MQQDSTDNGQSCNVDAAVTLRTDAHLSDDDLTDEAKTMFSNHTEILNAFQLTSQAMLRNPRLSQTGRHLSCFLIEQNYAHYKKVINYVAAHPELKANEDVLHHPIFICGLPRTGTTLLYNLLACDPACRAPLFYDMMDPIPPLRRSDTAAQTKRNKNAEMFSEMLQALGLSNYENETKASHPTFAYDEDLYIFGHVGYLWIQALLVASKDCEYFKWFVSGENKDLVYEYHKVFLQMLSSVDAPKSHWLLKSPIHLFYLDTLVRHYNTASLIMTHRRLDEVLPSSARMALAYTSAFFDKNKVDLNVDQNKVAELFIDVTDIFIDNLLKFRRTTKHSPILDVWYEDLMAKPIDTIREIYKQLNLKWSDEFEAAMKAWLQDNCQGKQGRNSYTLEEFNLDRETIDKRYADYNKTFLNRLGSANMD